jgi:hypothetical protein
MMTVATVLDQMEAFFIVAALEAQQIPAVLQDEYIVQQDWLLAPAVGGIKVQVPEEYFARAREIVLKREAGEIGEVAELGEAEEIDLEALALAAAPAACPTCRSENIRPLTLRQVVGYIERTGRELEATTLEVRECLDCGHEWEPRGAE